jgi:hypothetical protein
VQQSMWAMPRASSPSWRGKKDPLFRDGIRVWAARPVCVVGERWDLERSGPVRGGVSLSAWGDVAYRRPGGWSPLGRGVCVGGGMGDQIFGEGGC